MDVASAGESRRRSTAKGPWWLAAMTASRLLVRDPPTPWVRRVLRRSSVVSGLDNRCNTVLFDTASSQYKPCVWSDAVRVRTCAWSAEEDDIAARPLSTGKQQSIEGHWKRVTQILRKHLRGNVIDVFASIEHYRQGEVFYEAAQKGDIVVARPGLLVEFENAWQIRQIR